MPPEKVLMMNALLAVKLAQGAQEVYGSARSGRGQQSEVIDLPGGGKKIRLRGMDVAKLGGFLKSQGLVNEL